MAADDKNPNAPPGPGVSGASTLHSKGVKIFTYPKVIFIFPTLFVSLICGFGMLAINDNVLDPSKYPAAATDANADSKPAASAKDSRQASAGATPAKAELVRRRFTSTQNLLAVLFLGVFAFNMIVMSIDFPRFTIFAGIITAMAIGFFLLWISSFYDFMPGLVKRLEGIYAPASAQFYFLIATILILIFGIIYVTRYLDYWEIRPNEILHSHGPFSDLERFPTINLKFDKEIPDILEYMLLRAGRLVLHVTSERRAIVLDNVLFIDAKENELKKLMSRMDVRITTDQEVAET